MSPTFWFVDDDVLRAITWTLAHFLWQGTALAAALALAMRVLRTSSARYAAGTATLVAMIAAPVCTLVLLLLQAAPSAVVPGGAAFTPSSVAPGATTMTAMPLDVVAGGSAHAVWFTIVPVLWMAGVLGFVVRLAGGWVVTRRIVAVDVAPAATRIECIARGVAVRLGLTRGVRVVESARVRVPAMVGWLRPVVLLPAAAIAGLSTAQLEALIAHELVHVRRRDYLVNMLQMAVEAVLFFHPAVWWVSRVIRREREHCCDDEVVAVCDRMEYVSALTRLAEARQMHVALAATDGSLLQRVQRLLDRSEPMASGWTPMVVAVLVMVGLVPVGLTTMAGAAPVGTSRAAVAEAAAQPDQAAAPVAVPVPSEASSAPAAPAIAVPVIVPVHPAPVVEAPHAVAPVHQAGDEEVLRAQMATLEAQLGELKRQQVELERRREESQAAAMIENARSELDAARAELARVQGLVETGRADRQMAEATQARVRTLERSVQQAEHEAEFRQRTAALAQEQAAQMAQYDVMRQQYAQLLAERDAATQRAVAAQVEAEMHRERAAAAPRRLSRLDDQAAIAPGDVVRVVIEGETELPSDYEVSGDGGMRLPLLGRFVVQGRTAAAVRAEIRRALDRTGLRPGAAVRVEVMRAR